jgi:thiamine-monophosphate kinase
MGARPSASRWRWRCRRRARLAGRLFAQGPVRAGRRPRLRTDGRRHHQGPAEHLHHHLRRTAPGRALRRDAARAGDDIWISGTLGDARLALAGYRTNWRAAGRGQPAGGAVRMHAPTPRVGWACCWPTGRLAHAALDISDGLVGDLGHILAASKVGAVLDVDALPAGAGAGAPVRRRCGALHGRRRRRLRTVLHGAGGARGDPGGGPRSVATPVTRVGSIEAQAGLRLVDAAGAALDLPLQGFDHFTS